MHHHDIENIKLPNRKKSVIFVSTIIDLEDRRLLNHLPTLSWQCHYHFNYTSLNTMITENVATHL